MKFNLMKFDQTFFILFLKFYSSSLSTLFTLCNIVYRTCISNLDQSMRGLQYIALIKDTSIRFLHYIYYDNVYMIIFILR